MPERICRAEGLHNFPKGLILSQSHEYSKVFIAHGIIVEQILLESAHFRSGAISNFSRAVADAWSEGVIPIINENDPMATEKTTFGDNDKLARMAAEAIGTQMVVFFSMQNSEMNKVRGKGGAESKAKEIRMLQRQDVLVRLVNGKERHALKKAFDGDASCTLNRNSANLGSRFL